MEDDIKCPKCGSAQISANKKGFSAGKAVVGAVVAGGIGLVAGSIGSDKVIITCLKCGHQFKPGTQLPKEQMPVTLELFIIMVFIMFAILIPACGGSWWFLLIMPILGIILAFLIGIYKERSEQSLPKRTQESTEKSFVNKHDELSKSDTKEIITKHLSEKISIGKYKAYQIIKNNSKSIICNINYDISNSLIIMQIDGRKEKVSIHMSHSEKDDLASLLLKGIEWDSKAKDNKLTANKNIDKLALYTSFKFNNNTHTCDTAEIEITYCSFYQSRDYSYIIINLPSLYTRNTVSGISPSIIFIEMDEIQNICNILSNENIKLSIDKHLAEQTQIDKILN